MTDKNQAALYNFNYADSNNLRMDDLGERTKSTIRAALTATAPVVDVEGVKRNYAGMDDYNHAGKARVDGWNDCINYLAARGMICNPASRESKWQPIETAPRDGTAIQVFIKSPKSGDEWQAVVSYNDHYNQFTSGSMLVGHDFITHWMPLPEPPEVKK